jgi:micrococcal nuclease
MYIVILTLFNRFDDSKGESSMDEYLYFYRAQVTKVYDGDTCTVDIDVGLGVWVRGEKIRLYRIDTPELRGEERPEGLIARDYLISQILDKSIYLQTVKDKKGKYGRYLGEIWVQREDGSYVNVNDLMVQLGYAEYYMDATALPAGSLTPTPA